MAKKGQDYNTTAKALGLANTPQQFAGMGMPPAPGAPGFNQFVSDTRMRQQMANNPENANRLAQTKGLAMQGLSKDAKKNAVKEMLAKFKGKGGRIGGILGGGMPGEQIR